MTDDQYGCKVAELMKRFPWIGDLSSADRQICTRDLTETQDPVRLQILIAGWRASAEAAAAGIPADGSDLVWLAEPIRVERPDVHDGI